MKKIFPFVALFLSLGLTIAADDGRSFPETEVFINNHQHGDTNGCSGSLGKSGKMTCGHPKAVSEVSWKLIKSTEEGDLYRFVRVFPKDSETPTTEVKEVNYHGEILEVWRDSVQRIVLRPRIQAAEQD